MRSNAYLVQSWLTRDQRHASNLAREDEDRVRVFIGDLSEIPCRVGKLPIGRVIFRLNSAYNGRALCKNARKGEYRGKLSCR